MTAAHTYLPVTTITLKSEIWHGPRTKFTVSFASDRVPTSLVLTGTIWWCRRRRRRRRRRRSSNTESRSGNNGSQSSNKERRISSRGLWLRAIAQFLLSVSTIEA
jgi:hypothetical protein